MSATVTRRVRALGAVADYVALTKPRIVSLLLLTAVCGYLIGAQGHPRPGALLAVAAGGFLAAGGANALNCALDRDLDGLMARTRGRPIPAGRIRVVHAVALGISMNALAVIWLAREANGLAAGLALAGSAWYLVVYTWWLKRRTTQNIVIGGAAGCFPPLVGLAAATGTLNGTAFVLAGVIFLWTPAHFWALATLLREDYRQAGVPMLPVVASRARTARGILAYATASLGVSILPVLWGGLGRLYLLTAIALGGGFVGLAEAYRRHPTETRVRKLFQFSLVYLAGLFLVAVIDQTLHRWI